MNTFAMVRYGQRQSHPINSSFSGRGNLANTDLIQFPSNQNCKLKGPLNIIHEGHWELAINNRRAEFFEKLKNWSTQASSNELVMAIMPNIRYTIVLKSMISKKYKGGMGYATLVGTNITTNPQCEIVWRGRTTRPPSPMFGVCTSVASGPCAPDAPT